MTQQASLYPRDAIATVLAGLDVTGTDDAGEKAMQVREAHHVAAYASWAEAADRVNREKRLGARKPAPPPADETREEIGHAWTMQSPR